jgi:hypothetical protein
VKINSDFGRGEAKEARLTKRAGHRSEEEEQRHSERIEKEQRNRTLVSADLIWCSEKRKATEEELLSDDSEIQVMW